MLEPAGALDDDVEANPQPSAFGMEREPRLGGMPDTANLLGIHHLEGIAKTWAGLALHLAEDDRAPTPRNHVELVPARPDIRAEDPIGPKAVPARGTPLGGVTRLPP